MTSLSQESKILQRTRQDTAESKCTKRINTVTESMSKLWLLLKRQSGKTLPCVNTFIRCGRKDCITNPTQVLMIYDFCKFVQLQLKEF